jgi:SAM-dependent methyltransferase
MNSLGNTAPADARYTFNNANPEAEQQVGLLADILDDHSTYVLSGVGIQPGWRCLDIGAGAGTITDWLANRVRPGGHVTALDLDPRHLRTTADNIDIVEGDVRTTPLRPGYYDLIHARLVYLHLPTRQEELGRLVQALRPGGVLVLSEWDCTWPDMLVHAASQAAVEAFEAFQDALLAIVTDNGADLGWARRVAVAMLDAGLVGIETTAHNQLYAGGGAGCLLHVSNSHQMQDALVSRGVTQAQLNILRAAMTDPTTLAYSYWMFTTVGRRPGPRD